MTPCLYHSAAGLKNLSGNSSHDEINLPPLVKYYIRLFTRTFVLILIMSVARVSLMADESINAKTEAERIATKLLHTIELQESLYAFINDELTEEECTLLYTYAKDNGVDSLSVKGDDSEAMNAVLALTHTGIHPEAMNTWTSAHEFYEWYQMARENALADYIRSLMQAATCKINICNTIEFEPGDAILHATYDEQSKRLELKKKSTGNYGKGAYRLQVNAHELYIAKSAPYKIRLYVCPSVKKVTIQQFPDCWDMESIPYFFSGPALAIYEMVDGSIVYAYSSNPPQEFKEYDTIDYVISVDLAKKD